MKLTLGKEERLKSRKLIQRLYTEGSVVKAYPLRMVFLQTDHPTEFPVQFGVSVPKRNFKKAVDRNRIKRQIRECYRLNKNIVYSTIDKPFVYMVSYLSKDKLTTSEIDHKMKKLLNKFLEATQPNNE